MDWDLDINIYFEPRKMFNKRIENLEETVTFSELVRSWDKSSEIPIEEVLGIVTNCIITTEDCSSILTNFLENAEFLITIFKNLKFKKILINNPPHFFYSKLLLLKDKEQIETHYHKYKKLTEKQINSVADIFDERIIGQSTAKKSILRKLIAQMIRPSNKPLVLMFYGEPGVGKTETARYLSDILYGNKNIVREQMSMAGGDYSVKYYKSTSHADNSFSKTLLNRESNIILLDEFALAPNFFHTTFFQMFDEGIFVDQNFTVDVSNSIIICTSNLLTIKEMEETLDSALLSRFDGFIHFQNFSIEEKKIIATKIYDELTSPSSMKAKYKQQLSQKLILNEVYLKLETLPNVRAIRKYVEDCVSSELMRSIINNKK